MRVRVTVEGGTPGDADDLLSWLLKDPDGAKTQPSLTGGSPDQMGTGETVLAVVNTAIALGGFVITAATWLDARKERRAERRRRLRIEREGTRRVVTLEDADPERIEEALRALLATDGDSEPEGQ
ncbi:hypothetical protein [Streptomyces sp. NPDC057438]|uniref:effector-associated constant component EACC1 n=1 Tax=Streptomyces sp. NPDC057438 TaxID=3346133 RepID=UPI0036917D9C